MFCNLLTSLQPGLPILQHRVCNACMLAHTRFGLFPVRSPLLRESLLLSFPRSTKMFQFLRFRINHLCIQWLILQVYLQTVFRFGDPRIKGCLLLPGAYSQGTVNPAYSETFIPCKRGLHPNGLPPARGVAGSGFRPMPNYRDWETDRKSVV